MKPIATIILPTFNHGEIIAFPIRCVLSQTFKDFELFVVGDGISEEGREVVNEFSKQDGRIRLFAHKKGERHGERYRHLALQQATGEIVCYLSDDDLWLPDHLAYVFELLDEGNFGHALPFSISPEDTLHAYSGDLKQTEWMDYLRSGKNFIPLSNVFHTKELYDSLPFGWRPAPKTIYTDLHMWLQFFEHKDCKPVSGNRPTVLHFPNPLRANWNTEERAAELERWEQKISAPNFEHNLCQQILSATLAQRAELQVKLAEHQAELANKRAKLEEHRIALARTKKKNESLTQRVDELKEKLSEHQTALVSKKTKLEEHKIALARAKEKSQSFQQALEKLNVKLKERTLR